MTINYTEWRFWIDMLQTAVTFAIGIFVWWDRRRKGTEKRFSALEDQICNHAQTIKTLSEDRNRQVAESQERLTRISELEKSVHHLPSREEIGKLSDQIGALASQLAGLDGRLSGINRAVDLLNEHHIRNSQ